MKSTAKVFLALVSPFCGFMLVSCGGASVKNISAASANSPSAGSGLVAFVTNAQNASLSVIDTETNNVTNSVQVGMPWPDGPNPSYPSGVAITPDGTRAYIADGDTSVWVMNTATNKIVTGIVIGPAGTAPFQLAVTPNGKTVYVTTYDSVVAIDTATDSVAGTISLGKYPYGIVITSDGARAYVSNQDGKYIWVIDTKTNTVAATIQTPKLTFGIAISPYGGRLYVTDGDTGFLVVDTKTNALLATVPTQEGDLGCLAISPDGRRAYIAVFDGLLVIDTSTNNTVAKVPIFNDYENLLGVAVTPDGSDVYVTSGNTNTISVIATATNSVVANVNSPVTPNGVAISSVPR